MNELTLFNKLYIMFQIIYILTGIISFYFIYKKISLIDKHLERQNKGKGRW